MLILSPNASRKARAARAATKALREVLITYKALMEDALRGEGLTLAQLRLLHAVAEQPEASGAAIARTCQVTPQTLQTMLTRAVREGWITRDVSETNHRIITAALTPRGGAVLERGNVLASEIEAKLWRGISLTSLQQLVDLLHAGVANLKAG